MARKATRSQAAANLKLSSRDFPSLSGTAQTQQQQSNANQATWSNSNPLRSPQQMPGQRAQPLNPPFQPSYNQSLVQRPQQQQPYLQTQLDGQLSTASDAVDDNSEYRFRAQPGVGQLTGATQAQTGNIDEFPPLGGSGAEFGQDRRGNLFQSSGFSGLSNGNHSGAGRDHQQDIRPRNGIIGQTEQGGSINSAASNRIRSPTGTSGGSAMLRGNFIKQG